MLQKQFHGHVDSIADGSVSGWAVDIAGGGQPTVLFVFIDGVAVANATCSFDREDLRNIGLPAERAGFRYRIPIAFLDDKPHQIAIRFGNGEPLNFADGAGGITNRGTFQMLPPTLVQGHVDGLVGGSLRGWVLAEDHETGRQLGGLDVIVWHGGAEIGRAKADRLRPDVAKALDCDPCCGFAFTPPPRFRTGDTFLFVFKTPDGSELANSPLEVSYPQQQATNRIARLLTEVEGIAARTWALKRELRDLLQADAIPLDAYDSWFRQYRRALGARRRQAAATRGRPPEGTLISIVCPVYRPRLADFRAAVDSVLAQSYPDWELILVDDGSESKELSSCLAAYAGRDKRIRVVRRKKNGHISAATNAGIAVAKGAYVAFLDHDDVLEDVALEVMMEAARETGAKMLYSDEDKIDDFGRFSDPNLKPDWNYRLMLGQNYVCHLLVVDAIALRKAGPLESKYNGAQDHELILRLSEIVPENGIHHVPEVLYHWRKAPGSTAAENSAKAYAITAGTAAVKDHLKRRGFAVEVAPLPRTTLFRVAWKLAAEPRVAIVIPFRDQTTITRECLAAIKADTAYRNYEVILVDNWSTTREAKNLCAEAARAKHVRICRVEEPFNFSRLNNLACAESDADYFMFMNNDVVVRQKDWLRIMVDEALADPRVGAVGAMLLYPNGAVQHGGVTLGIASGVADHAYVGQPAETAGFQGRALCAQELSAVTGALMLCRASAFREAGGFDEQELAVAYSDVDFCLKLRQLGYRVVWTPAVVAEHHESLSRGDDMAAANKDRFIYEEQAMFHRWGAVLARDPFYNPHFSRRGVAFAELSVDSISFGSEPQPYGCAAKSG